VRQHPQTIPAVAIALERDAGLHSDKALVERALAVVECLAGRGFEIVPTRGRGWANRFDEARRTGDWRGVSDADWKAWLDVMRVDVASGIEAPPTAAEIEDDIARFARTVPLTQDAVTAGVEALDRAEAETEKAARWASVLIAQILGDGSKRQCEAGVDVAAQEALNRLQSSLRTDTDILGVFYGDGLITFCGDAAAMVAFRDMASKIAGVPGSRASA